MPAATIDALLQKARESGASDVHFAVGHPVTFRVDGVLIEQETHPLTRASLETMMRTVAGDEAMQRFAKDLELDCSYSLKDGTRLRINCHRERGEPGMVARVIPTEIPALESLGLADIAASLDGVSEGLVLFTGPTGAGKSTSMASLLQSINAAQAVNIITLEDPIEFVFSQGKGIVRQRQFGSDFLSFPHALRHVLRQDPDIVMVGEMRDFETIAAALTLAETGHLVLATLHTPNAMQTVDRIIDVFPPHQQQQIRTQLSLSLKAIVAQRLLPRVDGGRIAQREILINTPAAANMIRDNRVQEMKSVLQTGKDVGMCTFESDAQRLFRDGEIDEETYEQAKIA